MDVRRLLVAAAGVTALVVALAVSVPDGPVTRAIDAIGSDYFLVAAVAGLGLLVAAVRFHSGRTSAIEQATMPEPERPVTVRSFGDDIDAALANRRLLVPVFGKSARRALHADLRETAVRTVCRVGHCGPESACDHLARGDWTDDAEAAAFLRGDEPPRPSLLTELSGLLRGEPWFRTQATAAAEAVVDVASDTGSWLLTREHSEEVAEEMSAR